MPTKRWSDFFLYLGRVFILLILLAVLLPKLIAICNIWMTSVLHHDQKPMGNPMKVEAPEWVVCHIVVFNALEMIISTQVNIEQGKPPSLVESILKNRGG